MDGTLVDSETVYVEGTKMWLNQDGIDIDIEKIFNIIGLTEKANDQYLADITGLDIDYVHKRNLDFFKNDYPVDYEKCIYEETDEVIKALHKKGYKIAICSMSSPALIEDFIKYNHLEEYIDLYLSNAYELKPKPDPEIYLIAMEKLGLKAEECIVVEDSRQGIKAGKDAGCYTIARDGSRFNIDQSYADRIIIDLRELLRIVE